jgi:hypothetical protein
MPQSISVPSTPRKAESQGLDSILPTETHAPAENTNNVHSPRPLPLPFASSPETSPYRNLLGISPAENVDTSISETSNRAKPDAKNTELQLPRNQALKNNRRTPAARQSAQHDALTKVDQIMQKGWSERDVKDARSTASPTMFGAIPGGEDALFQVGIQESGKK